MGKRERILMGCHLFEGIEEGEVVRLLPCLRSKVQQVEEGDPILPVGEVVTHIAVLISGRAEGDGLVLEAGNSLGEEQACAGAVLTQPVVACTDCDVLYIDCRRALTPCDHSCKCHKRLVRNLVSHVARQAMEHRERVHILSQRTTQEKLMVYLRSQAAAQGSNEFAIPLDRQGLADYLGVERSAMSTEIGKLSRNGIIETKKSWFKLL